MLRKAKTGVEVGDRFIKTDDKRDVWIVTNQWDGKYPVPHYQVVMEGHETRRRTLSQTVLLDPTYYIRVVSET